MSMIVVASKGTILSYSIYRSAAIFNFLGFALDIFGIFCVVSWLFCTSPDANLQYDYELYGYGMWRASFYYFCILQFVAKCFCYGICGVVLLIISSEHYRNTGNHPWRQVPMLCAMVLLWTLMAFPILLVLADGTNHIVAIDGVESIRSLSESIVGILQQIIFIFDCIYIDWTNARQIESVTICIFPNCQRSK